jgi:hypothetical protein
MDLVHGHNFERFIDFSDPEFVTIREKLHQEAEARDAAGADDRLIETKEDNAEEDEITNDEPSKPGLLPPVAQLCLED